MIPGLSQHKNREVSEFPGNNYLSVVILGIQATHDQKETSWLQGAGISSQQPTKIFKLAFRSMTDVVEVHVFQTTNITFGDDVIDSLESVENGTIFAFNDKIHDNL